VAAAGQSHHLLFIGLEQQLSSRLTKANRQAPQRPATPPWLWLLLICSFGLVFWQFVPKREGPNPPPAPTFRPWLLFWLVALFLFVSILAFAIQFLRSFDPGVRRANKRALAGDLDGAIEDLREQIEDKGPTQVRANALGLLLMQHERWAEAAALFSKAEEMGSSKGVCKANLGLALLKGGKPAEAVPVLREALHTGPRVPVMTCLVCLHTCLALAELGQWDEAHEQFRGAEEAARGLSKAQRAALAKEFEQCLQKLDQQPPDKPKPEGLTEL
jgi:tetratricopeptide (TPR) repeat protein